MKGIAFFLSIFILAAILFGFNKTSPAPQTLNMPLVLEKDPKLVAICGNTPVEERGVEVRRWLQGSFKIKAAGGVSGSGTLCYYDKASNTAYVISCGHLWSGNMTTEEGKRRKVKATIVAWYHNNTKLQHPREYEARVICYSNKRGYDLSLLTFEPDWRPKEYYPIAPRNYPVSGSAHSMGCDDAREVAHYHVEIIGIRDGDLVTQNNSPRPGRSGGGLVSNEGYFIGVCWATSDYEGEGIGYFTPLSAIHKKLNEEGFDFLLKKDLPAKARNLKIIDENNPQGKYPRDYILLPE
jgi:hypothetical protein